ncbi:MAG: CDP-glycerol glycerophosphotransferase family protein [Ruminococcus sp.]|nr:CDP-glycerol glycerophosphotransferase family protein [Ruminococcus sp.]
MLLQQRLLPALYNRAAKKDIQKGLVVFADAHHNSCPFSMKMIRYKTAKIGGLEIRDMYLDFQRCSKLRLIKYLWDFMALYARAEYVFICDNFLPAASCKKRSGTKVIQLWHSGGLLKKAGYDTEETVPGYYKGEVYGNCDLWTVSAPCVVPVMESSMHQPEGVVQATGISRTDVYFNERYNRLCVEKFYEKHPDAKGKTVVLWAPTFRGNAAQPYVVGEEEVEKACRECGFYLIKKLHPHMRGGGETIPTERLFAVADLLITDYSSVVFDYLAYSKPFVFFVPDKEEYLAKRGLYVDLESFPSSCAENCEELAAAMKKELERRSRAELTLCYNYHMMYCDGKATDRIIKKVFSHS